MFLEVNFRLRKKNAEQSRSDGRQPVWPIFSGRCPRIDVVKDYLDAQQQAVETLSRSHRIEYFGFGRAVEHLICLSRSMLVMLTRTF